MRCSSNGDEQDVKASVCSSLSYSDGTGVSSHRHATSILVYNICSPVGHRTEFSAFLRAFCHGTCTCRGPQPCPHSIRSIPGHPPGHGSPHLRRSHLDILAVCSHRLPLSIALQRLAHVESILAVVVVVDDPTVDGIPAKRSIACVVNGLQSWGPTHPIFLYSMIAASFSVRTKRSTNHAFSSSPTCSSASDSRVAWPLRLAAGDTVNAVMCACHGR